MLEFQFGDPYDVRFYGVDLPNASVPITVIGPMPARNVRIVIRGRVEALAVLFRPCGLNAIFGIPLAPLVGTGTEGAGVLGGTMTTLHQQLGNMRVFSERVSALETFLVRQLHRSRRSHAAHRALNLLASVGEGFAVQQVASEAGLSTRQFERIAHECTGISPVVLSRLQRFRRALRLRQTTDGSWTWIAHEAGYYDQMHMIREFGQFAGAAPEKAMKQISPEHLISFMCR
jgi:AraC-like DNA-binding protein